LAQSFIPEMLGKTCGDLRWDDLLAGSDLPDRVEHLLRGMLLSK
jgi:hypothetical protein